MNDSLISETNYMQVDKLKRRRFLADNIIDDHTALTEEFVLSALSSETDPVAKWLLIKAAGILRSTGSVPILLQICLAPDLEIDQTSMHAICAWALGRFGNQFTNEMIELLSSPHVWTRRCAADALGEMRSTDAIPPLTFALRNDERPVQLWAALSLAKIGLQALGPLELIVRETGGATKQIALDAVRKIEQGVFTN